jgi:two-component system, NarL family, response regulator DesR
VIRVLIAEDQAMVRGALAALLRLEPDIDVVAQAERGDEAVRLAMETKPDIVLLDIELPGTDGLTAAEHLRTRLPSCRVVMLTTFDRAGYLRRAVDGGAVGFLLKDAPAAELAKAVRTVMAGRRVIDPALALTALSGGDNPLTAREREVLAAASTGATVGDIATRVSISEGTVRNHLSVAIQKVGGRNRFEAAKLAEQKGWL